MRVERAFVRQRKDGPFKASAGLSCYLGLSGGETRGRWRTWEDVSHEAVRQWFHRIDFAFCGLGRKHRGIEAMDETRMRIENGSMYLSAAMDTDTREILGVYPSTTRSRFDTFRFLKGWRNTATTMPLMLTCKCTWDPLAGGGDRHGLRWRYQTLGNRNPSEQWLGIP